MTNKHHELVEEIGSLIKIVAMYRNHEVTQAAEGAAMVIITLILSAVRDGRLDEELGVVGHGKGYADTKGYDSGFAGQADVELEIDEHTVRRSQVYDGERLEFIALRGTGKEEQK